MRIKPRVLLLILASLVVLFSAGLNVFGVYKMLTLKRGEEIKTPLGTVEKPLKKIVNVKRKDQNLIVNYSDGTTDDLGFIETIQGKDGKDALIDYRDIEKAVSEYCSGNKCKGKDGTSVTDGDIAQAIADFCKTGICKGEAGKDGKDGLNGLNGRDGEDGLIPEFKCETIDDKTAKLLYRLGEGDWHSLANFKGECIK